MCGQSSIRATAFQMVELSCSTVVAEAQPAPLLYTLGALKESELTRQGAPASSRSHGQGRGPKRSRTGLLAEVHAKVDGAQRVEEVLGHGAAAGRVRHRPRSLTTAGVEGRSSSRTSTSTRNPRPTTGHPHSTRKSRFTYPSRRPSRQRYSNAYRSPQ